MSIAGLVLAGGRSSRMGSDKALTVLDGMTLLERAVARLAPQVKVLAVSANSDPAAHSLPGAPILPDTLAGFRGPLAGLLAGLQWTARETDCTAMVSVAVDTPFFPLDLVARLAEASASDADRIVVARSAGRAHPVFALWPLDHCRKLERFLATDAKGKVMAYIEEQRHVMLDFPSGTTPGSDLFFNVNTPADLAAARALLAAEKQ